MKKKAFLVAAAVLAALLAFSACTKPSSSGAAAATPSPKPTQTGEKSFIKAGETYRYLHAEFKTDTQYLESEGLLGDYVRIKHKEIQEKYGITMKYVVAETGDNWFPTLLSSAYAGASIADVANAGGSPFLTRFYMYNGIAGAAIESLSALSEAATFSDPEYWDLSAQENLCTFGSELYFAAPNAMGPGIFTLNQVMYFNKRLVEGAGFTPEQLYAWNKEGNWTWERYRELLVASTDPEHEVYGTLIGQAGGFLYGLIASNDAAFVGKREANGTKLDVLTAGEENGVAAYEFFADIARNNLINLSPSTSNEVSTFSSGKYATMLTYVNRIDMGLMNTGVMYMEDDYGLLLPPKGPNAADYVSDLNWVSPYCVMKNISNPLGSAQLIEEFFAPSLAKSSPENESLIETMATSWVRDTESMEVLKSIPKYSRASSFMMYLGDVGQYIITDPIAKFPAGEVTPANYFASVQGAADTVLQSYQESAK